MFVHNHHFHAIPRKSKLNSGMRTFLVRSGHLWNSLAMTMSVNLKVVLFQLNYDGFFYYCCHIITVINIVKIVKYTYM